MHFPRIPVLSVINRYSSLKSLVLCHCFEKGYNFFVYVLCFRAFMVKIRLSLTRHSRAQFQIFCTLVSEPFIRSSRFLFQILNSITEEVLDHIGTFRSPLDQLEFIIKRFKEGKMTNFMHKNVVVYLLLREPGHFLSL